ncbi:MAG: 3-dehydroquinate synthase [Bacillota bacterium]|nr:3-dehydroquinate synthase [Bacillota bacterium]
MKCIEVKLKDKSYPLHIEKGIFNKIGTEIKKIYKNDIISIVTDTNLDRIYGEKLVKLLQAEGYIVSKIVVPAGEKSKSIETLTEVYKELLESGIHRGDLIIAFGGGVVGDLTGFAASTLFRGISFVQIPTSLLAQIDSSIGGKVAVDLKEGKNLVGSFYHPESVYIDSELLKTLEDKFLYDGMAEVIKYGAIKDEQLFNKLFNFKNKEDLLENIDEIIYNCCSIKRDVVEIDEKDIGERMLLNFGHTIGHAIEKYFNYEKYTHGEAVAAGMYLITKNSEDLGITEKGTADLIYKMLIKYNLPVTVPQTDAKALLDIVSLDKKNIAGSLNIVLIKKIGDSFIKKIERKDAGQYLARR